MTASETDSDSEPDPDIDALNEQEWTLGRDESEIRQVLGMEWKMSDPTSEDGVTLLLSAIYDPHLSTGEQYRIWVDQIIDAPEVTDEKWASMTPKERTILGIECMDFFDLETVVDDEVFEEAIDTSEIQDLPDDGREVLRGKGSDHAEDGTDESDE